jgi:MFS family permease
MCLFAVVVGTAIACLGAISNVFLIQGTTVANRARYFCALHASYGFGSFLGPLIVSMIVAKNGYPWPWVFVICIPYLVLLMVLFSRLNPHERAGEVPPLLKKLSKVQVTILSTFALYVVGEVLTSMWMISYLEKVYLFPLEKAARYSALFFVMMGLTRIFCFLSLPARLEFGVLVGSLVVALVCLVAGQTVFPEALIGVGVFGPFFPLFMARVSRTFQEQASQLTLWILGFIQLSLAFAHLTLGKLSDWVGISKAYALPPVFMVTTLVCLFIYLGLEKQTLVKR